MRRAFLVTVVLLTLSACGMSLPGDDTVKSSALPPDVNNELVYLQCKENNGTWLVEGKVKNPTEQTVNYTVLVYIGAVGIESPVTTLSVPAVVSGQSGSFEMSGLKAATGDAQCWVRVQR